MHPAAGPCRALTFVPHPPSGHASLTQTYYNATSGKNFTGYFTNLGSGQICNTRTQPFGGSWDLCPTLTASWDCALGPLSGARVWNRADGCSTDCLSRINKFNMDYVYK